MTLIFAPEEGVEGARKLNLDFGPRDYDANPREPLAPIEPPGAIPPQEAPGAGEK
jgi:hypothetical protein